MKFFFCCPKNRVKNVFSGRALSTLLSVVTNPDVLLFFFTDLLMTY